MAGSLQHRGVWWQRFLVVLLAIVLGALFYWLFGFVLADIGTLPGPDRQSLETERLDPQLRTDEDRIASQIESTRREIQTQESRQRLLRDSTASSQQTLNQLLEIQRLSIEQDAALSDEQRQAFVASQQLFLDNQRRDQELNESIAALNEQLVDLQNQQRANRQALAAAIEPINREYERLWDRHQLLLAGLKIGVLVPLMLIGAWLMVRRRDSIFAPLIYALDVALLLKVFQVMHEYFPSEYFKYILIGAAILLIGWLLARLLQLVARPSRDWRLRQYREAYEAFMCPICRFPIRRGPLKFMSWTARSLRRQTTPTSLYPATESPGDGGSHVLSPKPAIRTYEPYTCPACATPLYEACASCGQTRHALLPACEHCGAVKEV